MNKSILIFVLIVFCVLLTGCSNNITDQMGRPFVEISKSEYTTFCYDIETKAVYIVYNRPYLFGVSPYIMFDEENRPTVGQWNGTEIVPAEAIFEVTN